MVADAIDSRGLVYGLLFFVAIVVGSALAAFALMMFVRRIVLPREEMKQSTDETPVPQEKK